MCAGVCERWARVCTRQRWRTSNYIYFIIPMNSQFSQVLCIHLLHQLCSSSCFKCTRCWRVLVHIGSDGRIMFATVFIFNAKRFCWATFEASVIVIAISNCMELIFCCVLLLLHHEMDNFSFVPLKIFIPITNGTSVIRCERFTNLLFCLVNHKYRKPICKWIYPIYGRKP